MARASPAASARRASAERGGASALRERVDFQRADQAREQVFYADLTAQLAAERQRASSGREGLIRAMGVWGADVEIKLPNRLPALPGSDSSM